jgi:predicted nucleic acid-binding protein
VAAQFAYFDTSVLVKRYVREAGSKRAAELLRRYRFLSSAIVSLEALSAFSRRKAAGELSERSFDAILSRMRSDRDYWELVEPSAAVLNRSEEMINKAKVRTLDALHIASALMFQDLSGLRVPFITADERQREGAQLVGLQVTWVMAV